MPFVRDTVPRRGGTRDLQAYLERTLERLDDWEREVSDRLRRLEHLRAVVGIRVRYQWDDTIDTVATPAPPGFTKGNNAIESLITQFSFSRIDEFGREVFPDGAFGTPIENGIIQITDFNRDTVFLYNLTGPATGRATDILIDVVSFLGIGAPPQQDDFIEAAYWPEDPTIATRAI